jgi:amino acid efflux transporter
LENSGNPKAKLKLPQITALYIGAVIGSGILIIPGVAAEVAGPASLAAWGLMAVLVIPMAMTMALLSAKYPGTGGVSHFVSKAFNPHIGSLIGWYFTMAVAIGVPVIAYTGAGYFCAAFGLGGMFRITIAAAVMLVGLLTNYFGIKLTGLVQTAVVLMILVILIAAIAGSLPSVKPSNFTPFMPDGFISIGSALTILFWCFLGWEAVSNISGEFYDPKRDAVTATIIAAIIISVIYFLTAFVIVGTHSYGAGISDTSLVHVIKRIFGTSGAAVAGFAGLFVCVAPVIAYIGAISRQVQSLAQGGYAPAPLARISKKYGTPAGGLLFMAFCFGVVLAIFAGGVMSMAQLLLLPNAAFILTYIGGCAAGIVLLKDTKYGVMMSVISLIFSSVIFLFVSRAVAYPVIITVLWVCFMTAAKKFTIRKKQGTN